MGINSIKYIINFVPLHTVLVSKIEYDVVYIYIILIIIRLWKILKILVKFKHSF